MKNSKKASKRLTLRKKNKILKKVREHNVTIKKLAHSKFKPPVNVNVPGMIPNNAPFKFDVLEQFDKQKELQKNKALFEPQIDSELTEEQKKLIDLANRNELRQKVFFMNNREFKVVGNSEEEYLSDICIKKWSNHLEKVVEHSDLVIQILDARSPNSSRCLQLEEIISKDSSKKLMFLLNRSDLIPTHSLTAWINHLRQYQPTLAFCCKRNNLNVKNDKKKKNKSKVIKNFTPKFSQITHASCNYLFTVLKELQSSCNQERNLRVGIIGMPNTGKNEIIKSLKQSLSISTKDIVKDESNDLFKINLTPKISLFTTPGNIYSNQYELNNYVIRNLMKISHLSNLSEYGNEIYEFCGKDSLRRNYCLPDFGSYEEFISLLAKKLGYINKGSIPDSSAGAQKLVKDWCDGNILYFTLPAQTNSSDLLLPIDHEMINLINSIKSQDEICQGFQVNSLNGLKYEFTKDAHMEIE